MSYNTFAGAITCGLAGFLMQYSSEQSLHRIIRAIETGGNPIDSNMAEECKSGMVVNAAGALKILLSMK